MRKSKIIDIVGATHLASAFVLGMPLTAFGIFLFFIPMFHPDDFIGRMIMASIMTVCGSFCLIHLKYDDWYQHFVWKEEPEEE